MVSPFTVVKGDEFTRLTPAGIIRCLQVQDRPSHPCGSVTAGVYGGPRGVTLIRPHIASRDTPVAAHGRSNGLIASHSA